MRGLARGHAEGPSTVYPCSGSCEILTCTGSWTSHKELILFLICGQPLMYNSFVAIREGRHLLQNATTLLLAASVSRRMRRRTVALFLASCSISDGRHGWSRGLEASIVGCISSGDTREDLTPFDTVSRKQIEEWRCTYTIQKQGGRGLE